MATTIMSQPGPKPPKPSRSFIGAPAQHTQGSRKGKRAWRKNIDIDEVEEDLEGLRAEERVTGTTLQQKKDNELFQIDFKGDDQVRKSLPRFSTLSQLTSTKILSQRSAVPAVLSRTTTAQKRKPRATLSREDKSRLLRIGKRLRHGPLNTVLDPTTFGSGSAILELSEAVKNSGHYDPWAPIEGKVLQDGFKPTAKAKVKPPVLPHPRNTIGLPAVVEPHPGTSYNPPASAHHELLLKAHEIEEQFERNASKQADLKAKMEKAMRIEMEDITEGVPSGMTVSLVHSDAEDEGFEDHVSVELKKVPKRKTEQQQKKATRLLAEKHLSAEKASKKRMLEAINSARQLRRATQRTLAVRQKARAERQHLLQQRAKRGLIGQKFGKHKVPKDEVDVQLGEDLSESLRGLKPEGNLFRDRFLSLQHRALVEPRVPVLPTKRSTGKIYEKHPWKRFE